MSLSALRSVGDAIEVTREFLFPLSIRRWGGLAFVALFLGTAGTPIPANPQFLLDPNLWNPPEPQPNGEAAELPSTSELAAELLAAIPRQVLLAVVGVVVAVAVVGALWAILASIMRFVFVESLRSGDVRILGYARRRWRGGLSVFLFNLTLGLLVVPFVVATLVLGTPVLGDPVADPVLAFAGIVTAVVGAGAAVGVGLTNQFVVPVMIREECDVLAGWRRLSPTFLAEWKEYLTFGVVRVVLGAAVGIAVSLVVGVIALVLFLLFGTVGGTVLLAAGGFEAISSTPILAVLGLLGALFAVSVLLVAMLANVPFHTYLWYYALLVLGDIDEGLDLVADRRERIGREGLVGTA